MAIRTISDLGGEWGLTTTWVEGVIPTIDDDVVATATSGNLYIYNAAQNNNVRCKSLDLSLYTGTLTGSTATYINGNLTTGNDFTNSYTGVFCLYGTCTLTMTSNHIRSISVGFWRDNAGAGYNEPLSVVTLASPFNNVEIWDIWVQNGRLVTNGVSVNVQSFGVAVDSDPDAMIDLTGSMVDAFVMDPTMGDGAYISFYSPNVIATNSLINMYIPAGTSECYIESDSNLNNVHIEMENGVDDVGYVIMGSSSGTNNLTLNTLTILEGTEVRFKPENIYVQDFIATGTASNIITLTATTSAANLYKTTGTVACDYLDLTNVTATGGADWYAGSHSIDNGGNSGWLFMDPGAPVRPLRSSSPFACAFASVDPTPPVNPLVPTTYATTPFLANFNGLDGATSYTSETGLAASGTFALSNLSKKYGNTSIAGFGVANFAVGTTLDFGTGDFTIDQWINPGNSSETSFPFAAIITDGNTGPFCVLYQGGQLGLFLDSGSATWDICAFKSLGTPNVDEWSHIAITRNGNDIRCFLNGTQIGDVLTTSASLVALGGAPLTVGARGGAIPGASWSGYLGPLRFSNVCRWTSNFTPPTNLYELTEVPDLYTKLLINADGANGATTHTALTGQEVTFVGNAQLSTDNPKFGTASAFITSTTAEGNYISVPASTDWTFPGDFTIDFWAKPTILRGDYRMLFCTQGDNLQCNLNIDVGTETNEAGIELYACSQYLSTDVLTWTLNGWNHIAIVRSGETATIYFNGVASATGTGFTGTAGVDTQALTFGYRITPNNHQWVGSFDEIRVSKGIARWTSNFTPPTAPYTL